MWPRSKKSKRTKVDLASARLKFFQDRPHFYPALSRMPVFSTDNIPTMAVGLSKVTNEIALIYNPEFLKTLTLSQASAVLEHECLHLLSMHPWRLENRDPMLFNIAADALINEEIEDLREKFKKAPFKLIYYDTLRNDYHLDLPSNHRLVTVEALYDELVQLNDKQKQKMGKPLEDPNAKPGEGEGWKPIDPTDQLSESYAKEYLKEVLVNQSDKNNPEEMKELIDRIKEYGSTSADLIRGFEDILGIQKPLSWQQILARFVATECMADKEKTYMRPSRRFSMGFPGKRKEYKTKLLLAIDTSGSIDQSTLDRFVFEISHILKSVDSVVCLQCDCDLKGEPLWLDKNNLKIKLKNLSGGGGTSFQPVFDWAKGKKFDGCIYFTDGYADHNIKTYRLKTIFASTGCEVAGFKNVFVQ